MAINIFQRNVAALPVAAAAILLTAACSSYETDGASVAESAKAAGAGIAALEAIVAARSDEDKARDQWRHPVETLAFFGLAPDDSVIEALPGGGWYSKIILPYVAENGRFAGVIYQYEMFPLILPNPTAETLAQIKTWPETFPGQAAGWAETAEPVAAFEFGAAPEAMLGQADVLLMIRALHNFNRAGGDFRDAAIARRRLCLAETRRRFGRCSTPRAGRFNRRRRGRLERLSETVRCNRNDGRGGLCL